MTPTIGSAKQGMELEKKGDAGHLSNSAARLMAAEVFKLNNSEDGKDWSAELRDPRGVNRTNTENAEKSFFRRKIAAHIIKKAEREREAVQRDKLAKIGEPLSSDFVRINNNLSLQISRHTSRHSRYGDDDSTESDDDDADSFCDEDEPIITQDVQMENSLNVG